MFALVLLSLLTALCIFIWNIRAPRLKNVPGPPVWPIIGNTVDIWRYLPQRNKWLIDMTRKYGAAFQANIPGTAPFLLLSSPTNLEYVLKTNFDNYPKGRPFTDRLIDLLGRGIFNSDGEIWRHQRKAASHIFTMKALRDTMTPIFVKHANVLTNYILASKSVSIDFQDCFFRYTLDSIALIAFGVDLHCLAFSDKATSSSSAEVKGNMRFAAAFDEAQRIVDKRFFSPSWQLWKWLGIGDEGRMTRALLTINSFAAHVINERRQCSRSELLTQTDLLSQFILSKTEKKTGGSGKEAIEKQQGEDELEGEAAAAGGSDKFVEPDDDNYIRDVILNFIIAGRDTTAQLLTWCCYELTQHPEVQERCRAEVNKVVGITATPTYDAVNHLPYLHAVLHETLRLHPSVPVELKHAVHDDVLPDGNIHVPAGTAIVPLIQAQMRRKDVFGEDADEFRPERWLDDADAGGAGGKSSTDSSSSSSATTTTKKRHYTEYEFPAFQAGPRTCLGKAMALLEAKIMMCMLLQRMSWEFAAGQREVEEEVALTLPSRFPMMMEITKL